MNIHLLFFGPAREQAGLSRAQMVVPEGIRVHDLETEIRKCYPGIRTDLPIRLAIESRYADADDVVPEGAEIAIIPPVSGG